MAQVGISRGEAFDPPAGRHAPASCPLTIATMLDRLVGQFPDHEAAVDSGTRLTFRALDDTSRRLITQLRAEGVRPGDVVALLTLPSTVHLVAWLALARMGAIPMALHTRESDSQLAATCAAFGATALLHDASFEAKATAITSAVPGDLARMRLRSAVAPADMLAPGIVDLDPAAYAPATDLPVPHEDDIVAIVLSSGTTAIPKGITHSHRTMMEAARSAVAMNLYVGPGARTIVPLSTAFTGCFITWLPLLHGGGCSVFVEKFELERYAALIPAERITHMSLTPTMWRKLLTLSPDPSAYATVRVAISAAEPLDSATLDRLRATVTPHVLQAYGSTEVLGLGAFNRAEEMVGERLLSVGQPFPSTEIRLVGEGGLDAPAPGPGEVGEIWISSPCVAPGVWSNPEVEAKLFHFDGQRRWWRSGDLGRFDADGFLFLEGRRDDMIISGGINIMPAAIEDALLRHPAVLEVAVVGVKDPEWGEQPHAFVVVRNPEVGEAALDRFMRSSALSDYQRPRAYHFMDALPYTSTNKLNRRALRLAAHASS